MYLVAVRRSFTAKHFLLGADFGSENKIHSHNYTVEVVLEGSSLDNLGFLVNIENVNVRLDSTLEYFNRSILNNLSEFEGLNPSVEHFSRIFCNRFLQDFQPDSVEEITVRIWEYEDTWAQYSRTLQ